VEAEVDCVFVLRRREEKREEVKEKRREEKRREEKRREEKREKKKGGVEERKNGMSQIKQKTY